MPRTLLPATIGRSEEMLGKQKPVSISGNVLLDIERSIRSERLVLSGEERP